MFRNQKCILDLFLECANKLPDDAVEYYKNLFEHTIQLAYDIYGEKTFCMWKKIGKGDTFRWTKRATTVLYDPLMVVLSENINRSEYLVSIKNNIVDGTKDLFEKNDDFSSEKILNLNHKDSNESGFQNDESFFNNNKSISYNNCKEDIILDNNSNNHLDTKNSDNISINNTSHNGSFTDYSSGQKEIISPSLAKGDFFNKIEPAGREIEKSNFLEHNGNIGQNGIYTSDNENYTTKNPGSYRRENQINGSVKGIDGKKRGVKKVIIFYNDGSFEELYPSGIGK